MPSAPHPPVLYPATEPDRVGQLHQLRTRSGSPAAWIEEGPAARYFRTTGDLAPTATPALSVSRRCDTGYRPLAGHSLTLCRVDLHGAITNADPTRTRSLGASAATVLCRRRIVEAMELAAGARARTRTAGLRSPRAADCPCQAIPLSTRAGLRLTRHSMGLR